MSQVDLVADLVRAAELWMDNLAEEFIERSVKLLPSAPILTLQVSEVRESEKNNNTAAVKWLQFEWEKSIFVVKNIVPPTDLWMEVTGRLLLCGASHWLLWGFSLLWVPGSSGGDGGRAINYSAAIGVDERLAW